MSNVPTNLIPTRTTELPEYAGVSQAGYFPYVIDGRTYKVQFSQIAATSEVPPTRSINTGVGLAGGGNLTQDRTIYIVNQGVGYDQLSKTGVVAGTYGTALNVPVISVDDTGRVTSVTTTAINLPQYVPTTRTITAGTGLTGGGDLSADRTISISFSSATPLSLGVATAGTATQAARGDHVHPAVNLSNTTETQGVLPLTRGGTGNALSPVAGAIIYTSGAGLTQTAAGSAGQVLTSSGGGAPYWQTLTGTGTVTSVSGTGSVNGITLTGSVTTSGSLTLGGTLSNVSLTTQVAGTLPVASGGTGQVSYTNGQLLIGNSTGSTLTPATLTAGSGIIITNGPGSITIAATGGGGGGSGTVTSVDVDGGTTGLTFSGGPVTTSGTITMAGTLGIANGGTGATTAADARTALGAANIAGDTFTGPTVVSVSSASDAFRVTQTGAGNAILVEDNVNPDSSPFVVTGTGNVGIGLTAPTYKFHVAALLTSTIAAFEGSTGTNKPGLYISTDESLNTTTLVGNSLAGSNSLILGSGGALLRFHTSSGRISTSSTTTDVPAKFTVNNGVLGAEWNSGLAGTTIPAEIAGYASSGTNASKVIVSGGDILRVNAYAYNGTSYIAPASIRFVNDGTISTGSIPTSIRFHTGTTAAPSERMRITSSGNVGINFLGPTEKLCVNGNIFLTDSNYLTWGGTANYITGSNATNSVSIFTNGNSRLHIDSTGNVGIGTASPAYPLDVNGSARIGGALRGTSGSIASAATITPTSDTTNQYNVTALATGATLAAPSGTPVDGQKLTLRIKDNGTAQTLTWTTGSSGAYRAVGATFPSTTVAGKTLYVGCIYNSADARWDVVATSQEA